MSVISEITTLNGETYKIRDAKAIKSLEQLSNYSTKVEAQAIVDDAVSDGVTKEWVYSDGTVTKLMYSPEEKTEDMTLKVGRDTEGKLWTSIHIPWVLLWLNPDSSVAFTPQTVEVDTENYDTFLIVFRGTTNTSGALHPLIVRKNIKESCIFYFANSQNIASIMYGEQRKVNIDENGFTFGDCYRKTLDTTTAGTKYNSWIIPYAIYGFQP